MATSGGQQAGRAEAGPDGEHLPGPGRRQRGDSGRVGARVAAANGDHPRPRHPRGGDRGQRRGAAVTGVHEQRQAVQGRGCLRHGQHRRVGDHPDARQRSREHIPGHPRREHGARVQRLDPRPQRGAHHGPARPRRGQQQWCVGPQGRPGGRRQLSGPVRTGNNHHRRRDEQFLRKAPGDHIGRAGQYRRLRRRQAGPCGQTDMRLLAGPGSTSAGRGGSNRCQRHEHRCGRAQHPRAALAGRPTQRAAFANHACGPSVASVPPPHGGELSLPQARHRQPSIVAITPRTSGFSRSGPGLLDRGT